jgi:hypothetical protein
MATSPAPLLLPPMIDHWGGPDSAEPFDLSRPRRRRVGVWLLASLVPLVAAGGFYAGYVYGPPAPIAAPPTLPAQPAPPPTPSAASVASEPAATTAQPPSSASAAKHPLPVWAVAPRPSVLRPPPALSTAAPPPPAAAASVAVVASVAPAASAPPPAASQQSTDEKLLEDMRRSVKAAQ